MEKPPDADYEAFWLGFKKSIKNFYHAKCLDTSQLGLIDKVSDKLNKMKENKQYDEIKIEIDRYICDFSKNVIIYGDYYYSMLLKKNLKKWQNLSQRIISYPYIILFNCFLVIVVAQNKRQNDFTKEEIKLLDFIKDSCKNTKYSKETKVFHYGPMFESAIDFSSVKINCNLKDFVVLAINAKKAKILDILSEYFHVVDCINRIYGVTFFPQTAGKKILLLLEEKEKRKIVIDDIMEHE